MTYKILVRKANDLVGLQDDMNAASKEGFSYVDMYESNARIIMIMEKAKVGRPKKNDTEAAD